MNSHAKSIPEKYQRLIALLLVFLMMAVYMLTIREGHPWGGDFSMYIHHAMNIADGIPYDETGYIYNPYNTSISPRMYPVGYPLLLAPVIVIFGMNLWAMKVQIILLHGLVVSVYYVLLCRDKRNRYPLLSLSILVFSPYFWDFKDIVVSDISFLLWVLLCLWLLDHLINHEEQTKRTLLLQICAGVVMYFAFATRMLGIVLLPVMWITGWIRHRTITSTMRNTSIVFMLFLVMHWLVVPSDGSYFDSLDFSLGALLHNIGVYAYGVTCGWAVRLRQYRWVLFGGILGLFILYGYVTNLRRKPNHVDVFCFVYLAAIIIWPWTNWRFIAPLLPWCINYLVQGVDRAARALLKKHLYVKLLMAMLVCGIVWAYTNQYRRLSYRVIPEGIANPATVEFFDYIRNNTEESDVFVFFKPRVLALYTDRAASGLHIADNDADYWTYYESISADYLVIGPYRESYPYWEDFISRSSVTLTVVFTNTDFVIYEIKDE